MIAGVPTGVPIIMIDSTSGAYTPSLTITGTEIKVQKNGGAWITALGVVTENGGAGNGLGNYNYLPHVSEVESGYFTILVDKTGYVVYEYVIDVEAAPATAAALATTTANIATMQTNVTSIVSASATLLQTTADLRTAAFGRWKVIGTQLLIYEDNGITVLETFNLKDDEGLPSSTRIFERVPV